MRDLTYDERRIVDDVKAALQAAATPIERIAATNRHNTHANGIALTLVALDELAEDKG